MTQDDTGTTPEPELPGSPPASPPHGDPLRPTTEQPGPPTDPGNAATG